MPNASNALDDAPYFRSQHHYPSSSSTTTLTSAYHPPPPVLPVQPYSRKRAHSPLMGDNDEDNEGAFKKNRTEMDWTGSSGGGVTPRDVTATAPTTTTTTRGRDRSRDKDKDAAKGRRSEETQDDRGKEISAKDSSSNTLKGKESSDKPAQPPQPQQREKKLYTPRQSDEEGHFLVVCGENLTERYKILDLMGQGTFAKVIEAWDRKEQQRIAIKIVRATKKYTKDAQFELDILERIRRKDREDRYCTVKVQGSFMYHDPRTDKDHLCIIFPKLGPSLLDFINKNATFSLRGIAYMTKHICEALDYLHRELHLIHTDLKPENILLPEHGYTHEGKRRAPRNYHVRIIDFGGATGEDHSSTSIVSTRHYRAPEVIVGSGWMYPADMWSVGTILIELYTGEVLFDTHENREHLALMEKIIGPFPEWFARKISDSAKKYFKDGRLNWPEMASSSKSVTKVERAQSFETLLDDEDFTDLIRKLLDYDKKRRLTAREALSHPFVLKYTSSESKRSTSSSPRPDSSHRSTATADSPPRRAGRGGSGGERRRSRSS